MKKLFAILLTLVMAMSLATTAFAEDTNPTITAPDNNRTYAVYQIFTGDLSDGVLSNIKWGQNGTGTNGTTVAKETLDAVAAIAGSDVNDAGKAEAIAAYVKLDSTPVGTVTNGSSIQVPAGYYLIKDNGPVAAGEAYSVYVVEVIDSTTIAPKTGTTTSQKKVDDKNDSNTSEDTVVWQDSADYDIGDAVPFQLKAVVGSDYANYNHGYKLTFHDKECEGLTFNESSVKVYVNGKLLSEGYTVTAPAADGDTFDISFANLKTVTAADNTKVQAGSVISVEYTSTLNTSAKIGAEGNPNTMHITYTNNPHDQQAGDNGKTPDDKVIVFTYKVVVNKVDNNGNALTGAGFTLYKKNAAGAYEPIGTEIKGEAMTQFSWVGIDDGDYKLVESTTPTGYNTIAPIEFTVSAEHATTWEDFTMDALTNLSGGDLASGNVSTGVISANIENLPGATLPETGGIGTQIFYAVGGVLVLAAVVLLVSKKRMGNKD